MIQATSQATPRPNVPSFSFVKPLNYLGRVGSKFGTTHTCTPNELPSRSTAKRKSLFGCENRCRLSIANIFFFYSTFGRIEMERGKGPGRAREWARAEPRLPAGHHVKYATRQPNFSSGAAGSGAAARGAEGRWLYTVYTLDHALISVISKCYIQSKSHYLDQKFDSFKQFRITARG